MKIKAILIMIIATLCCVADNSNDAYKQAHRDWLNARGEYYTYCRTKYEPGVELAAQEKALQNDIENRKVELYQGDEVLKPLYEKYQKALKDYKADKNRNNKNMVTTTGRALKAAWKKSECVKDELLLELQNKEKSLDWRRIYIDARGVDPEAKKLFDAYTEKSKIKDEIKKAQK